MNVSRGVVVRLAAVLLIGACTADRAGSPEAITRDSSGIAIVSNTAPLSMHGQGWRLDSLPEVAIGVVDGAPEYQLFRIRGALRLADGQIVVAENGSKQLRFYDAAGRYQHFAGGDGAGPGEYRAIHVLGHHGTDSLVAWDGFQRRGTILGLDGSYGRNFAGPKLPDDEDFYILSFFRDGSMLGVVSRGFVPTNVPSGVRRHAARYFRFASTGTIDTLGEFSSNEQYISQGDVVIDLPFGRRASHAAGSGVFYFGFPERYEIHTFGTDGRLIRILRYATPDRPLTRSEIDFWIEQRLARVADPGELHRRTALYREIPYPNTLPAYADFRVGSEENLWVAAYRTRNGEDYSWTVFDRVGRLLGSVETPASFTIHDIGPDYVLGVAVDELDVERVELYRLVKPRTGS